MVFSPVPRGWGRWVNLSEGTELVESVFEILKEVLETVEPVKISGFP